MIEETPDIGSDIEAAGDVLAERRARRAQEGDPTVMRRADAAEAAVRNLETHLAALEQRLEEVGRERERIAEQLAQRESDVSEVKQREYAAQQLRVEAEARGERIQREMRGEIESLSARLEETDRHVRELDAELTRMRERDARLTPIVHELMEVAAGLRTGFERELAAVREELQQQVIWERETYVRELTTMGNRMEDLRFELTRTADDLRAQLAAEASEAALLKHTTEPQSEREATHRREMADALVAAVERLRTRVAEVKAVEEAEVVEVEVAEVEVAEVAPVVGNAQSPPGELALPDEPTVLDGVIASDEALAPDEPPDPADLAAETSVDADTQHEDLGKSAILTPRVVTSEPVVLQSRPLLVPKKRTSWLAPAIRRLAAQRDAKLAAELVIELIPAQAGIVRDPVSYEMEIQELGSFHVALDSGGATISREPAGAADFSLEGSVEAFSELAAGGAPRKQKGLRIRKGRRPARRFLKLRRRPIALADLAAAQVDVWPGLLLLAMAEAIDPSWTTGRRFELAFEIQENPGLIIYVRVCDGEPLHVSRTTSGHPVATVTLSGHGLICLLAGVPAPTDQTPLVTGDAASVDMFLQWTARAQGLSLASR